MSNSGKQDPPDDASWARQEGEPSWVDDGLPLEVRRQLLDRELRRMIQRKHARAGGRSDEAPERSQVPDHPGASSSH